MSVEGFKTKKKPIPIFTRIILPNYVFSPKNSPKIRFITNLILFSIFKERGDAVLVLLGVVPSATSILGDKDSAKLLRCELNLDRRAADVVQKTRTNHQTRKKSDGITSNHKIKQHGDAIWDITMRSLFKSSALSLILVRNP